METSNVVYTNSNTFLINKFKNIQNSIIFYNNSMNLFSPYTEKILKHIKKDDTQKKCKICKQMNIKIENKKIVNCLLKIFLTLTGQTFLPDKNCYKNKNCFYQEPSRMCFLFLEKGNMFVNNKKIFKIVPGTFIVIGEELIKNNVFTFPKNTISFHDTNIFNIINSRIIHRLHYSEKINHIIEKYKKQDWKECFEDETYSKKNIINYGGFGIVRKVVKNRDDIFILKLSQYDTSYFYTLTESFILKYVCNDIIKKKICPNVPYTFEVFSCKECLITINNEMRNSECLINCSEIGNYDLEKYLEKNILSVTALNSLLFQIMAGLHTLQYHYQVCHFDIKAPNILIYNVTPGGYWKYVIYEKEYYIPNYGFLAIINDFGLAKCFRAEYKSVQPFSTHSDCLDLISFGTRMGEYKNGHMIFFDDEVQNDIFLNKKFIYKKGDEILIKFEENELIKDLDLLKNPKKINLEKNIIEFLNNPNYPLSEFYNDTQDVIRIFMSKGYEKMTAQRLLHKKLKNIPNKFKDGLFYYFWKFENLYEDDDEKIFDGIPEEYPLDPEIMFAGAFINHYFKNMFREPQIDILEIYKIS
jgi:hypothetical protein